MKECREERWEIERHRSGERGFTLVELLLVLVIMGVLAAIVTISVVGLIGRGKEEGYEIDERHLQSAVTYFYYDTHAYDAVDGWNEDSGDPGHNYPTASGQESGLYPSETESTINGQRVHRLMEGPGDPAEDADVADGAIWMALLVNGPGSGAAGADVPPGDHNSPLERERGPYLNEVPKSCRTYNSSRGHGTYTWIVGTYHRVWGVFQQDTDEWYVGFNGSYP